MTLILRPNIEPSGASKITLMTAVAAAEAILSQVDLNINIKWPNDILVNGKKLVGILTEISTEIDAINYITVGLGLNVNTPLEDFPQDIREIATSIRIETGIPYSRVLLLQAFLEQFELYYDRFKNNEFPHIRLRWKQLSNAIGKKIIVDVLGQKHTGIIMDIDDDGVLILKDEKGEIQRIISGDIAFDPGGAVPRPWGCSCSRSNKHTSR